MPPNSDKGDREPGAHVCKALQSEPRFRGRSEIEWQMLRRKSDSINGVRLNDIPRSRTQGRGAEGDERTQFGPGWMCRTWPWAVRRVMA
jgi:hypothetical protein